MYIRNYNYTDFKIKLSTRAVGLGIRVMMFNAPFNNISAISWHSVLLVEETGVSGENN